MINWLLIRREHIYLMHRRDGWLQLFGSVSELRRCRKPAEEPDPPKPNGPEHSSSR